MRDTKRKCSAPHCHMCEIDELKLQLAETKKLAEDMLDFMETINGHDIEVCRAGLRRRARYLGVDIYKGYSPSTD